MDLRHMLVLSVEGGKDPAGAEVIYAPLGEDWSGHPAVRRYPLSRDLLTLPADGRSVVPRIGLGLCGELTYGPDGLDGFEPRLFTVMHLPLLAAGQAREPIAARLNWGEASVGASDQLQFVDRFEPGGVLDRVRIAAAIKREGKDIPLIQDIRAQDIGLSYDELRKYLVFTLCHQAAGEGWSSPAHAIAASERPSHALVCVGTATSDAEPILLQAGDTLVAAAYDREVVSVVTGDDAKLPSSAADGVSLLHQRVTRASPADAP